jgi:inner membrane protein
LIDLDHVPFYLWGALLADPNGRPVTHSLATVVVLLALSAVRRLRVPALGLALGVLLHLARDLATGPGVPLLWPLVDRSVLLPYAGYAVALTVIAVIAALAALRASRARVSG